MSSTVEPVKPHMVKPDWVFDYSTYPVDKPKDNLYYTFTYPYELLMLTQAKNILELGMGAHGSSTWLFIEVVKRTGGHLTSVDIVDCSSYYPPSPLWTFICADDMMVNLPGPYDAILIDTSHTYEQTLKELHKFVPLIRKFGYLLMHDTDAETVSSAIKKYIEEKPGSIKHVLEINGPSGYPSALSIFIKNE